MESAKGKMSGMKDIFPPADILFFPDARKNNKLGTGIYLANISTQPDCRNKKLSCYKYFGGEKK